MKSKFEIKNVKNYLGGPDVEISGAKSLTILFGKNGSGKSEYLRSIADLDHTSMHYCSPEKAGEFTFQANQYESETSSQERRNKRRDNLNHQYYTQVVNRLQLFLAKRGGWVDGMPPFSHLDMEKLLNLLLPDYEIKITPDKPYLQVLNQQNNEVPLNSLSSGERHIIGLGLDIVGICGVWLVEKHSKETTFTLLIDEPDAHLHADLHQNFAFFIKKIMEICPVQIIMATHSTTLLAAMGHYFGQDMSVAYIKKGSSKHIARQITEIHRELASILGGHALMGPLFNVPLLLVEGDDEYRIWSQVPRHHNYSFSVIPCNGEEIFKYQKTLEGLFESMLSTSTTQSGFALLDGDKNIPATNTHPQSHVKFIRLACHETENLYLTDTVLSRIGITWDDAKLKILSEADKYGNKADSLKNVEQWDRKTSDIKNIIQQISEIIDPKKIHWTTRIGQAIGAGELNGELNDFLGDDVIKSILK